MIFADTTAWVGLAFGVAGILVAGLFDALRRLRRLAVRQAVASERIADSAVETARQLASSADRAPRREPILIVDYIDRDVLEDIARQKGLQVDPASWEAAVSEARTEETGGEISADVGMPGVGSVGGRVSSRSAVERARQRTIGATRLYNLRTLLRELYGALDGDGELVHNLAVVPGRSEDDVMVVGALMFTWGEWGISDLGPDVPEEDPRRALGQAVDLLTDEGLGRIAAAKIEELRAVVPPRGETRFALVETEWSVTGSEAGLVLENIWLVEPPESSERVEESVIVPGLLEVPVDRQGLTTMGQRRLLAGTERWLRVFGKIELIEDGTLTILPVVISAS